MPHFVVLVLVGMGAFALFAFEEFQKSLPDPREVNAAAPTAVETPAIAQE